MPFMQEYQCSEGHRFEYLHMGSRDTLPAELPCECQTYFYKKTRTIGRSEYDAKNPPMMEVRQCGQSAQPVISAVLAQTIVRGNSDFAAREQARLEQRSSEHYRRVGYKEAQERTAHMMEKAAKRGGGEIG